MISWKTSQRLIPYLTACRYMEMYVSSIQSLKKESLIWTLEHPPLYTAGTSAKEKDLLAHNILPVFKTGRGGQFTYHGPGQRIIYAMIDLSKYKKDVRWYVQQLEMWIINALKEIGIQGTIQEGRVGIWVNTSEGEKKISAIGVRVQKWITSHGISVNISPNLQHFEGIVPCGLDQYGVTSIKQLGINITMDEFDQLLKKHCPFN